MPLASVLTVPLELASVWLAAMGLTSGNDAFWALASGATDAEIAAAATRGFAAGFAHGFWWTIFGAVALALT